MFLLGLGLRLVVCFCYGYGEGKSLFLFEFTVVSLGSCQRQGKFWVRVRSADWLELVL